MEMLYMLFMVGVAATVITIAVSAVMSVSRKPSWSDPVPQLTLVETECRRQMSMSFVGADRRNKAVNLTVNRKVA
jgi:hypothetical protein